MRVLVMGSLNYDFVYEVDHIYRPGETIESLSLETYYGGKGLNQAIALGKAGVQVYIAGLVGEDGESLRNCCKEHGIDTAYLKTVKGKSGHAVIQVDKNGQNSILLYGGANRSQRKENIDEVLDNFQAGDILLLQNEINQLEYIIDKAWERKMTIVLNPSPINKELCSYDLSKISVLLLNEIEGEELTGAAKPEDMINALKKKYRNTDIVLTLGERGALCSFRNEIVYEPSKKVEAVDTTAAGDTFTGYFIYGLVCKSSIEENLKRSTAAAAIAVSRKGAAPSIPSMDEVEDFIKVI